MIMPRVPRTVIPNFPHHIVHRGARKDKIFYDDTDYRTYIQLLKKYTTRYQVQIWSYCLMPNHVHMIAVPADKNGLSLCFGNAHREYSKYFNKKYKLKGHVWEARFGSFPIDEPYLLYVACYIERNPVAAGMVEKPQDYMWSSCRAHLQNSEDPLVDNLHLLTLSKNWNDLVSEPTEKEILKALMLHEKNKKPLGIPVPGTNVPGT